MKFYKYDYSKLKLGDDDRVQKAYVTSVQENKYQVVTITPKQCMAATRSLSRLSKSKKGKIQQ